MVKEPSLAILQLIYGSLMITYAYLVFGLFLEISSSSEIVMHSGAIFYGIRQLRKIHFV